MKGVQPYGASDCYFLGIACFWMADNPDETTSTALRVGLKVMGVELGNMGPASHQLLRKAAATEPKHYWTHFWLGWSLIGAKDYLGAELAFTTCITLRPKYALSYAERARALSLQMGDKKNTTPREELRQRCLADLDRAARLEPNDAAMHFIRLHVYADLDMIPQAVEAATRWLELTPPLAWRVHRRDYQELQQGQTVIKNYLVRLAQQDPTNPAIDSTSALVHFALGSDPEALQAGTKILEAKAAPPQPYRATALAVRSAILLRQKKAKESLQDAKEALALAPNQVLAAASQARAREMLADWPGALADFQALDKLAVVDWQHLESYLGQARVLNHLARFEETEEALQLARDIDPRLANELAEQFAAARPK